MAFAITLLSSRRMIYIFSRRRRWNGRENYVSLMGIKVSSWAQKRQKRAIILILIKSSGFLYRSINHSTTTEHANLDRESPTLIPSRTLYAAMLPKRVRAGIWRHIPQGADAFYDRDSSFPLTPFQNDGAPLPKILRTSILYPKMTFLHTWAMGLFIEIQFEFFCWIQLSGELWGS